MTIKQYGGVFGRNPTFNNATIDGTLTVDQIVEKTGAAGITLDGVTLKDGNVVLANGKGIDFSATAGTGTSELFDDYEEGTWTPVLSFGNGTTGITYDVQSGNYVKIGNSVIVSCKIDLSSKGTDTGTAVIRGFPYTISSDGATGVIDPTAGFSGLVASGSTFMVIAGATGFIMRQTTTGREVLTNANFLNSAILSFTLCYIAA